MKRLTISFTAVWILNLLRVSSSLECLSTIKSPTDTIPPDRTTNCTSSSQVCGRADFELTAFAGVNSVFKCVEKAECLPSNCQSFVGIHGTSFSSCQFKCCYSNVCNNQSLSDFPSEPPTTTSLPMPPVPVQPTTPATQPKVPTQRPSPPVPSETSEATSLPTNPGGMSCAHGVTPPTGPVATIVKTCSSPSEVCARADFALPYVRGVTSVFNCLERANCTMTNACEKFVGLPAFVISSCKLKCCDDDLCNNKSLTDTTTTAVFSTTPTQDSATSPPEAPTPVPDSSVASTPTSTMKQTSGSSQSVASVTTPMQEDTTTVADVGQTSTTDRAQLSSTASRTSAPASSSRASSTRPTKQSQSTARAKTTQSSGTIPRITASSPPSSSPPSSVTTKPTISTTSGAQGKSYLISALTLIICVVPIMLTSV